MKLWGVTKTTNSRKMIATFDRNLKVSEHFKAGEFACTDEDAIFVDEELVRILEQVRVRFKRPVIITSGYRNRAHNLRVGGMADSMHKLGMAADFRVIGTKATEVYDYLNQQYPYTLGIGIYSNWLHLDTRFKKSRWEG